MREGKDFYKSFINDDLPSVPVRYLDREVDTLDGVLFPGLVPAPASTTPVFFLSGSACLSVMAGGEITWLVLNLSLLGAIPFLIVTAFSQEWLAHRLGVYWFHILHWWG